MLIQRRKWTSSSLIVLALVTAGIAYEVTRKPHVPMPALGEIDSIQMAFNSTIPNPKPILADSPQNKAEIAQLLNLLQSAKPVGYEHDEPFMTFGPIAVLIKLTDKQQLYVSQAWLPTPETRSNNGNFQVFHSSQEYIDIHVGDSNKAVRYDSPQLVSWLTTGWKKDWQQ